MDSLEPCDVAEIIDQQATLVQQTADRLMAVTPNASMRYAVLRLQAASNALSRSIQGLDLDQIAGGSRDD